MSIGNDYSMPAASLSSVMDEARHKEMVQRKIALDAVRQNIGNGNTKDKQLRTTCEDFESIFIQKIWEQMRKNVRKEGYLHSKDEEAYQSLFDIELAKKMSSAGGIGLADMLYEQLSQQMTHTARTTASATPVQGLQNPQTDKSIPATSTFASLNTEDLYSDLPENSTETTTLESTELPIAFGATANSTDQEINAALADLQSEIGNVTQTTAPNSYSGDSTVQQHIGLSAQTGITGTNSHATNSREQKDTRGDQVNNTNQATFTNTSWHTNNKVSAKPTGTSSFSQRKKTSRKTTAESPQNMSETYLPLSGQIISQFGWEEKTPSASREWNPGIRIAAQPGEPVKAIKNGIVIASGQRKDIGEYVTIAHEGNLTSTYGNIDSKNLPIGTEIKAGTFFAKIATNESEQLQQENISSLYYEVKRGEMALNPLIAMQSINS